MKTWIAAAAALLASAGWASAQETDPAAKIDALIQQLGSEDYAAREKATEELRAIGKAAEEALRKAAESPDAEVQARARSLLREIEKPKEAEKPRDPVAPRRGQRFNFGPGFNFQGVGGSLSVQSVNGDSTYQVTPGDGSTPFTLHRSAGGSVKLEYTDEKGEKKTAESESMEKFLKDHKGLAEKFGISEQGIHYGGLRAAFGQNGAQRAFQFQPGFRFQIPLPHGGDKDDDDPNAWPFGEPGRADRAAGAALERPSDTIRSHLEIPDGQGLVVTRVARGSDAEAAGLLPHDILLEIDGRKVRSAADVRDFLGKTSSLTVLRKGRKRTLEPGAPEDRKDF